MEREAGNKANFDRSVIAVKSSMLIAQVRILELEPKGEREVIRLNRAQSPAEILEIKTEDKCAAVTYLTLEILAKKYNCLFRKMLAIRAWKKGKIPLANQDWIHHQYFLVLDNQNRWHGASPANYESGNPINRLENLISGDLENVLDGIKSIEGGDWPSQEYIEEIVFSSPYAKPNILSEDKMLGLRIDSHGRSIEITELVDYASGKEIETVEKRTRMAEMEMY